LAPNLVTVGFPTDGNPLVIDMEMSAFIETDLRFCAGLGMPAHVLCAKDRDRSKESTVRGDALPKETSITAVEGNAPPDPPPSSLANGARWRQRHPPSNESQPP